MGTSDNWNPNEELFLKKSFICVPEEREQITEKDKDGAPRMVLTGNYTRMRVDNYTKEMLDSRDLKAFRKKPLSDFFKLMDCENPEDALDLMIEDYAACPYRPWSINGPKPLQNATREDVKDFKFCRYYYVIFCHYNKDYEHYNAICEPFMPKMQMKIFSMFGPIFLAFGGLMIAIGFCYPSDSDDYVYNYVAIRPIHHPEIVKPPKSRSSLYKNEKP